MPTAATDPWGALTISILPLFNGEALRTPIEELNQLVKRHISTVISTSPSKAVVTLENATIELLTSGMVTLNTKLNGVEDDKLVNRVVDRWSFFWDQVLTYVEGVLLPLQNEPLLSSLYRTPKRPSSPRRSGTKGSISSLNSAVSISPHHIDVRTLALRSFRDRIILPLFQRLYARLNVVLKQEDGPPEFPARLKQMLLVLHAQARQRPQPFSLTAPPPQLSQGEAAVNDLLRLIQSPRLLKSSSRSRSIIPSRAPSFLSGGVPRDRRGRIATKARSTKDGEKANGEMQGGGGEDEGGDETPRNAHATIGGDMILEIEREKEREFLESLRSPDIDTTTARASVGGWGLGAGNVENNKAEEEDELLDWDQAQEVVEKMIGMEQAQTVASSRRRMT